MAEKEVNVKVRLRTDSAVNWLKANPVLLKGEIGVEEDTGRIKIGNGNSAWSVLPYFLVEMRKQEIIDCFFPVHTVKVTTDDKNPGDYLGGVWEMISAEDTSAIYYWERKA